MTTNRTQNVLGKGKQERRRTYLINRAFQWKYTAVVMAGIFIIATMMSYALFGVLYQQARARIIQPGVVSVWENTVVIVGAGLAFSLALALGFGLWTILITHRICGPMHVIGGYLSELQENRLPKPRALRKRDEFKAFHEAFEQTIRALELIKREELDQLREVLRAARSGAEGSDQDRKHSLDLIRAQLATMCRDAAQYLGEEFVEVPAGARNETGPEKERKTEVAAAV